MIPFTRSTRAALAPALALLIAATATADPAGKSSLSDEQVLAALRKGGYVIYLRHAITNRTQTDANPVDPHDCSTQRQLNDRGRQQAEEIGEAIRALRIPVGEVLSSPYCRARNTAKLAFGNARIDDALAYSKDLSSADRQRRAKELRRLLSTPPEPGTNRIIVAHKNNLEDAVFILPKPEGAAWVFRPGGNGEAQALARIDPAQWSAWVGAAAPGRD